MNGRPGSSLGITGSNTNVNAARARRVTIEEKYRIEREKEAELDGNAFLSSGYRSNADAS